MSVLLSGESLTVTRPSALDLTKLLRARGDVLCLSAVTVMSAGCIPVNHGNTSTLMGSQTQLTDADKIFVNYYFIIISIIIIVVNQYSNITC